MSPNATWSTAQHDVPPDVEFSMPSVASHAYLWGFLHSEGKPFVPPYTAVREAVLETIESGHRRPAQAPSAEISDQRLRTWKSVFQSFGFIYVEDSPGKAVTLTALGRMVKQLTEDLNDKLQGANDHLAMLAVSLLSRHTLRNPLDSADYPADTDIHPYRFIWRAMRNLDNKIHWQEINRVLMHVTLKSKEMDAVQRIASIRTEPGSYEDASRFDLLGDPAVDDGDETRRRITPWVARAGFGGLLISSEEDAGGFYRLVDSRIQLIDSALAQEPVVPGGALASPESYLKYLSDFPTLERQTPSDSDESEISKVISAVRAFGDRKIICLSGLPGSGKTRLARFAVDALTEGDPYRSMEIQFHEGTGYDQFIEGFVPRPSGDGYELRPMTLRVINRRARLDPESSIYVLLIEELTRANVHSVLGELLTYIEHRNRVFRLSLSQDEEKIAPNLVIVATMNPRDKSALVLDHAILRRLHQIHVEPSAEILETILEDKMDSALLNQLIAWFKANLKLLPFGHGEFAEARNAKDLRDLWNGTLRYFFMDATGEVRERYKLVVASYPWA